MSSAANEEVSTAHLYMNPDVHYKADHFRDITVLFFVQDMQEVAEETARRSNGTILLGRIQWARFADTFPNLFISDVKCLKWCHCAILLSFHSPEVIFEQLSLIYTMPKYLAKSLKIVLPFFPTGTMERVVQLGEVATAKTLAIMLSQVPLCSGGPSQIILFDLHTLQNQFYFGDNVIPRMYTATDLMVLEIAKLKIDRESIGIAFPDDGAHKRYSSQFGNLDNIICNKVRTGNERIVTIREGEVKDRHVFIIDDLVHSGGTLIECAKVIKSQGAKSIHAFCAHAIFEGAAWKKFADGGPGSIFDTFYITDTHPMAQTLRTIKPFKVLTIAPLLVPILTDTELQ